MIDDDMKGAVVLKRSPKELRDHLVLKSPLLAHVEKKFFVMRGPALVPLTKNFLTSKAANGNCNGEYCCWRFCCNRVCAWLVGTDRGKRKDTAKERIERKERRKGMRKARARTTTTGHGGCWNEQREQRWTEPFRGNCGHRWK